MDVPPTDLVPCTHCEAEHFVSDLDFAEPRDDANTQFGWLVAQCPRCRGDIPISLKRLRSLLPEAD